MPARLAGERLDRALPALVEGLSRTRARKIIGLGGVYLGQERCRVASRAVRAGDALTATWHDAVSAAASHELVVLHEDTSLVVVDKPSGQHTQGTELGDAGTLIRALEARYGTGIRLMHRLDAPTSGAIAAGRGPEAVAALAAQFRAHAILRAYLAVTHGAPPEGPCRLSLAREGRRVRVARPDEQGSLPAHTELSVVERHGARALVLARLHTGRTHQVRVHLAALGCPVVGDRAYGGEDAPRLALHAWVLGLRHPRGAEPLDLTAAPPDGFWEAAGWRPSDEHLDATRSALPGWSRGADLC